MSNEPKPPPDNGATSEIDVSLMNLGNDSKPSVLAMKQGPGAPRDYELFGAEVVVGRAIDVDIPINSTDLSRRHMTLTKDPSGQYTLHDLGAKNGIYLNGVKVHSALLHEGDNIQLGTVVFRFHEGRS